MALSPGLRENVSSNSTFGRGVVTTAKICESEIVCDYHTDVIVTQSVLFQRENTHYMMDCGDFVLTPPWTHVLVTMDRSNVSLITDHLRQIRQLQIKKLFKKC